MIWRIFALSAIGGFIIGILPVEAGGTVPGSMATLVPLPFSGLLLLTAIRKLDDLGETDQ